MHKFKLLSVFLLISVTAFAQEGQSDPKQSIAKSHITDSIRDFQMDQAALMYPILRQFSITTQQNMIGNISSKLYGQDFFKGRFRSSRTTINMNVPIIETDKNLFIVTLGVAHQFFYLNNVNSADPAQPVSNINTYIPMINSGFSYTHRDTFLGKPISLTAGVNLLSNPSYSRRQFTFLGVASISFLRTRNSSLTGGVIVDIDPSSPAPAFPYISYFHKFQALDLDLMLDLPYKFALRKTIMGKTSLTAFCTMEGTNSFFDFENPNPNLPAKMTYSVLELKTGGMFEYRITRKLVASVSGGVVSNLKSRILEQGAGPNDYFINNKNSAVPYGQVGISLLPFWHPFKHEIK